MFHVYDKYNKFWGKMHLAYELTFCWLVFTCNNSIERENTFLSFTIMNNNLHNNLTLSLSLSKNDSCWCSFLHKQTTIPGFPSLRNKTSQIGTQNLPNHWSKSPSRGFHLRILRGQGFTSTRRLKNYLQQLYKSSPIPWGKRRHGNTAPYSRGK